MGNSITYRRQSILSVLAAVLLGTTGCASAVQHDGVLRPGQTVRLKTSERGTGWVRGELVSLDAESLRVALEGRADTVVALSQVRRLDVSRGRRSRVGRGALLGTGIGTAAGLIVALIVGPSEHSDHFIPPEAVQVVVTLLGTVGGAATGAVVGAFSRTERWAEVPRPWAPTGR
jgi:hypothetical protein